MMSVSPLYSATGGVFACEDDVCDAAEIDDVDVDGRTFLCAHPLPSFIPSMDEGWAEYANSA